MGNPLECVTGQLPFLREPIADTFAREESFRDLCAEYEECLAALARFEAQGSSSEPIRNEYAALRFRLEGEILRLLQPGPVPASTPRRKP